MIKITKESLSLTRIISDEISNQTFHHQYHILYDISNFYPQDKPIIYVEIGCYAGGSACLMIQRKNITVISIDIGFPISKEVVINNVNNLNSLNNNFKYILGDSHKIETLHKLESELYGNGIDILFIDGDHYYDGVLCDFEMYSGLVNLGGFIVFDDYNDSQYSPQVKGAVDHIVNNLSSDYFVIGILPNEFGARPESIDGNCFIIRKN